MKSTLTSIRLIPADHPHLFKKLTDLAEGFSFLRYLLPVVVALDHFLFEQYSNNEIAIIGIPSPKKKVTTRYIDLLIAAAEEAGLKKGVQDVVVVINHGAYQEVWDLYSSYSESNCIGHPQMWFTSPTIIQAEYAPLSVKLTEPDDFFVSLKKLAPEDLSVLQLTKN